MLEKILEEIEAALKEMYLDVANNYDISDLHYDGDRVACVASRCRQVAIPLVREIFRKHMNDVRQDNDVWIPCEEREPEVDVDVDETWEDDDCPEYNVTIRGASEATTLKYSPDGTWFDENGCVYDVIAWQPLPQAYRPEKGAEE